MVKYKILLHSLLSVVAVIAALIFLYAYGAFFQHDRYWNGTIKRVEETQIALVRGMAFLLRDQKEARDYDLLFTALNGKLAITIKRDGKILYTNETPGRSRVEEVIRIPARDSRLTLEIQRYVPPLWQVTYEKWLIRVDQWFTPKYDYLTIPFLTAFGIFYLFQYAIVWKYRERHISEDVRRLLIEIEKDR